MISRDFEKATLYNSVYLVHSLKADSPKSRSETSGSELPIHTRRYQPLRVPDKIMRISYY